MPKAPAALTFVRSNLADQTAAALRTALAEGRLANPLPGEHALAAHLGVSRPTLRTALATLAREGILSIARGRPTRINSHQGRATPVSAPASVCVISPETHSVIVPGVHPVLLPMRTRLTEDGLAWNEIYDRQLAGLHPERRLARIVAAHPNTCWLLTASTEAMQRWFSSSNTPALVMGSAYPQITLPSIDVNYRALGWHAGGVLLKHHHRKIILLLPARPLAGDIACRDGLVAYLKKASVDFELTELKAEVGPLELRTKLERLLSRPDAPTAIFSLLQAHTLSTLLHLLATGRKIPGQISLLARDLPPLLESTMPNIAHYSSPTAQLAGKALRLVQSLRSGRPLSEKPNLVTPVFQPGTTLGPAPRSS